MVNYLRTVGKVAVHQIECLLIKSLSIVFLDARPSNEMLTGVSKWRTNCACCR